MVLLLYSSPLEPPNEGKWPRGGPGKNLSVISIEEDHPVYTPFRFEESSRAQRCAIPEEPLAEVGAVRIPEDVENPFDFLPEPIIRYDDELRRIYVNRAWERSTGLSRVEVLSKRIGTGQLPVSVSPVFLRHLEDAARTGLRQSAVFFWRNARREKCLLRYDLLPEIDRNGRVKGILAVGREVEGSRSTLGSSRSAVRGLRLLHSLLDASREPREVANFAECVCRSVGRSLGCSLVVIALAEGIASVGLQPLAFWAPDEDGPVNRSMLKDALLRSSDLLRSAKTSNSPRKDSLVWRSTSAKEGPYSGLCVSLFGADAALLGALIVIGNGFVRFSGSEEEILRDAAQVLSLTLESGGIRIRGAPDIDLVNGDGNNQETERNTEDPAFITFASSVFHGPSGSIRDALDGIMVPIYLVEPSGSIIFANAAVRGEREVGGDAVSAKTIFDLDPDMAKEQWQRLENGLRDRSSLVYAGRHRNSHGEMSLVEFSYFRVIIGDHRLYIVALRDWGGVIPNFSAFSDDQNVHGANSSDGGRGVNCHDDSTHGLSPRKCQILRLVVDGNPTKAIAADLAISEQTVKSHLTQIYRQLGVSGRMELVRRMLAGGPQPRQ